MIARTSSKTRGPARAMQAPSFGQRFAASAPPVPQQAGNQYLQRLLAGCGLQAKLTVNQPGDKYEQEADRVADQVMRMPEPASDQARPEERAAAPQIQRVCPECEEELQRQPLEEEEELQRQPIEEEEEMLQSKELLGETPHVSDSAEQRIRGLHGGGSPLPASARAFFEPRFGRSFSQVRVHTDSTASTMAKSVGARAFTFGNDIVFGSGEFTPSIAGQRLLVHELTHAEQQKGIAGQMQRQIDTTGTETEPAVDPEATSPEQELSLRASVGREGVNNIDDVRSIQDKLLELGLFSLTDYAREYPLEKIQPLRVRSIRPDTRETGAGIAIETAKEEAEPQDETVPSTALRKTIAAIRKFQRLIFNGWSDGTIDVGETGTTLKRLKQTNAEELTRLKEAFEDRKREEKKRAQKERAAGFLAGPEAQAIRREAAKKIIEGYTSDTYFLGISFRSLDEAGLGAFLAKHAGSRHRLVLAVLDLLDYVDKDDVAYEISSRLSAEELMKVDPVLLNRLREELAAGVTFASESKEIERIGDVLGGEGVESGGDDIAILKERIEKRIIIFDYNSQKLKNQLLNENLPEGTVRASNRLHRLVVFLSDLVLSSLIKEVRISSVSTGTHVEDSLHYSGRAVDIGNEEIAPQVLPVLVENVAKLAIDEIIFDSSMIGVEANKFNFKYGKSYDDYKNPTLLKHRNHIHISVKD